jgi:hypothetical protein
MWYKHASASSLSVHFLLGTLLEVEMPKVNLASMSVDALLKLRDDIETVLSRKANELKHQLSRLGDEIGSRKLGEEAL